MRPKTHIKTRRADARRWFHCIRCNQPVMTDAPGTAYRNHCPYCLWSRHVDDLPGDRASGCGGAMEPIAVWVRRGSDWAIIHQCRKCGALHSNRIAGDDNEVALVSLAVRAISQPPFPLSRLTALDERAEETPPDDPEPVGSAPGRWDGEE